MNLYILRHGETEWNSVMRLQGSTDIPLNTRGVELARATGQGLRDIPIDVCFSSPLVRAVKTASGILALNSGYKERAAALERSGSILSEDFFGAQHEPREQGFKRPLTDKITDDGIPFYTDVRIREICFGAWEGLGCGTDNYELSLPDFDRYFTDPDSFVHPEGAEDIRDVLKREKAFLSDLFSCEPLRGKNVLIVSHGAAVRGLFFLLSGYEKLSDFKKVSIPYNCEVYKAALSEDNTASLESSGTIYYDQSWKRWI